jgi:hypothetical protein
MPVQETPQSPETWGIIGAFCITIVSATVSILTRIISGHKVTFLWVFTEYLAAILFGYLVYHAYPVVAPILPDYITLPMLVAVAAHSGGKFFKEIEAALVSRITTLIKPK